MSLSYDAMVESLMRDYAFSRDKAEATARQQLGLPTPDPDADKDARILEKAEQTAIVKLFRAHGYRVYSLSQARASKQTPGLPDLWVTRAELDVGPGQRRIHATAFWWESKRQVGGKRSTVQQEFAAECAAASVRYGFGDRHDAAAFIGVRER